MNKLKRIFVMPYLLACLVAGVHSGWHLFTDEQLSLGWLGAAIAVWPMLGFMGFLAVAGRARTSQYMWLQMVAALIGAGLAAVELKYVWATFYAFGLGLGGVFAYIFWYSSLGRGANTQLTVGRPLPDFELEDVNGQTVSSRQFHGRKALYLFFRGNWCPLCMAQIREVAEQYRELDRRGVNVVLVSPQSHEQTEKLAAKFDVPMNFCVDRDNRAAAALNIVHKDGVAMGITGYGHDTVYPTVLMTDENGVLIYADLTDNYRVRPEPETFLNILDGLPAGA